MLRLISVLFLFAFAFVDASPGHAQRGYRPVTPPGGGVTLPPIPPRLPDVTLPGTIELPKPPSVVVKPAPPQPYTEKQPESGMCCPCPGRNECQDYCCVRQ
jgi:hypothetical protein